MLKDVSFTIKPGESVGIVGKTGAGKTALVDLLLRTYNVPDGTLFVDGQDVNAVSIHSVRDACAYVPQDNFLFSDTIAHNIGFGVDDASQADIDRAAALADVRDNIVDFKDGYETVLGERGVTVSGGQKQRISIARALLKKRADPDSGRLCLGCRYPHRENHPRQPQDQPRGQDDAADRPPHFDGGAAGQDRLYRGRQGRGRRPHDELYRSCAEYRRMVDLQKLEDEEGGGSMANVNPLLLVGAVIGVVTALLVLACASSRTKRRRWALNAR